MRVVRTLLIRRRLSKLGLSSEEIEQVKHLATRLDALGNLIARGYAVEPLDVQRRFIEAFKYFQDTLKYGNGKPIPKNWFARIHAVGNVKVRLGSESDRSETVFIDLPKGVMRIRGFFYGKSINLRLTDSELEYIRDRIDEGGKAKFVQIWVDDKDRLNVSITFEREVEPIQPSEYTLVIDVNSWRHGIWWWLVRDGRVVSRGVERPNLGYVESLYGRVVKIEQGLGKLKRLGLDKTPQGKRLRRLRVELRRRLYAYLRDYVNEIVHRLIKKAIRRRAKIIVDYVVEESRRELLEEKLSNGLIKLYLTYLPRFTNLLETQAKWYGIQFEYKRLPSSLCPVCGSELKHIGNRIMVCSRCGFKANRDEVPIKWYIKQVD